MMNLLPPEKKKNLTREYYARLSVVAFLFFGSAIMIGAVLLVSVYIGLSFKEHSLALVLNAPLMEKQTQTFDEFTRELNDTNEKLNILKNGSDSVRVFERIIIPITERRGSTSITGITYEKSASGAGIVRVSGVAKDRESLRGFIKALEEEPYFTRVEAPVSNFVKDKDIEFSLEIGLEE